MLTAKVLPLGVLLSMSFLNPSSTVAAPEARGSLPHGKIVGGVETTPGEFPFMVSLQRINSSRPFCGGSLIADQWVLTAAHCVRANTAQTTVVRLGHHRVTDTDGTETIAIQQVISHPQYGNSMDWDYALLKLATPSRFSPVQIQNTEVEIPDDFAAAPLATVVGFGAIRESGPQSDVLLKVEKPLVSRTQCEASYSGRITDRMICSGLPEGGKDSCQGDSGGPLVLWDSAGAPVLTGVVSWGIGCARPQKYGVYSKVSAVADWIAQVTTPASGDGN